MNGKLGNQSQATITTVLHILKESYTSCRIGPQPLWSGSGPPVLCWRPGMPSR